MKLQENCLFIGMPELLNLQTTEQQHHYSKMELLWNVSKVGFSVPPFGKRNNLQKSLELENSETVKLWKLWNGKMAKFERMLR